MKKERHIFLAAIIITLLLLCCLSLYIRGSFQDYAVNEKHLDSLPLMSATEFTPKDKFPEVDSLVSASSIILLVEGLDEHIQFEYSILSACKVIEVYKGSEDIPIISGEVIYVHEPFVVANGFCASDSGYMLMQNQRKYVLFLNFYEQPEGYRYSDIDMRTFLLANVPWGKVAVKWLETSAYVPDINVGVYRSYESLKEYMLISISESEIKSYRSLCEQVCLRYNINRE